MRRFPNQTQIAAALTAALMLASLSACGSTDPVETQAQTADTASETEAVTLTEQQMYINNLPEADYGGDVFRILSLPDNISWGNVVSSFLSSIRRNGAEQLASLQEKNESKFEKTYEKIRDQYAALD